jgi:hypothetical protein
MVVVAYLVLDYSIEKNVDNTLNELDKRDLLIEFCENNNECLNAVIEYSEVCLYSSQDLIAEEWFQAIDDAVACIDKKSGIDIYALLEANES